VLRLFVDEVEQGMNEKSTVTILDAWPGTVFLIGTAFPGWTPLPSLSVVECPARVTIALWEIACWVRFGSHRLSTFYLPLSLCGISCRFAIANTLLLQRFVIVRPCPLYSLVIAPKTQGMNGLMLCCDIAKLTP
jgi:hypothetical protein